MKCLFCGKPLSRMSLRRDGDFCCREHRDRYHLRQGLSRVQEAHEFNVMARRRESPNPMRLDRAQPPGPAVPRVCAGDLPAAPRKPQDCFLPPLRAAGGPRLVSAAPMVAEPRRGRPPGRRAGADPPAIRPPLAMRDRDPRLRQSTPRRTASTATAFRNPAAPAAGAADARRAFDTRLPSPLVTLLPKRPALASRAPGSTPWSRLANPLPARELEVARRLEASSGVSGPASHSAARPAFPGMVPQARPMERCLLRPAVSFAARTAHDPPPPARPRPSGPVLSKPHGPVPSGGARERGLHARAACGFAVRKSVRQAAAAATAAPPPPRLPAEVPFGFPGVVMARAARLDPAGPPASPRRAAALYSLLPTGSAGAAVRIPAGRFVSTSRPPACPIPQPSVRRSRPAATPFAPMRLDGCKESAAALPRGYLFQRCASPPDAIRIVPPAVTAGLCGEGRPRFSAHRTVSAQLAPGFAARRPATLPFAPQAAVLRPAILPLAGTFAGTLDDTRSGAPFHMEDNFDAGLARWAGATGDWRLDAAGVRPCSLALFSPSLGARDYVLEFLAKVEHGAMTWIFRVENLENYYAVRIALVGTAGGPVFEMTRYAVIGGAAEAPVALPLPVKLRSRAAFRVQTRAAGNEFITELDGQIVDRWSDDRLPAGGIGFLADRDARARLYWVKLWSPARPPAQAAAGHLSPEPHGPGGSDAS